LKIENLELFDSAAQEYDRDEFLQQSTHTTSKNQNLKEKKFEALVRHLVGAGLLAAGHCSSREKKGQATHSGCRIGTLDQDPNGTSKA
jgi:hypothetical protein